MMDDDGCTRVQGDGFGLRGVYLSNKGDERKRSYGPDAPEDGRRWRIAAAHAGGEERGKRRRGYERSILGCENIYAISGTRF
jgi:hypothetical protein